MGVLVALPAGNFIRRQVYSPAILHSQFSILEVLLKESPPFYRMNKVRCTVCTGSDPLARCFFAMMNPLAPHSLPQVASHALCASALLLGNFLNTADLLAGEPHLLGTQVAAPGGAHHHPGGIGSGVMKHAATKHNWFEGTYLDPAIQRPDFFPHAISKSIPEYRQEYNRPRYWPGWIAYKIEPSSQEAMAWQTNYCNGNYKNRSGAFVPTYYYPKPWESLNTQPRPGKSLD